jgi:5-methylcytosine-specific restriction endonuclease McrA
MEARVRQLVRERAGNRCEYCRLPQQAEPLAFHVEHIVARQHRGSDAEENLALACHYCNLHKGPNLTGLDPLTGRLTPLFNPRQQRWEDHFVMRSGRVEGLTPVGRVTVQLLEMNVYGRLELRAAK